MGAGRISRSAIAPAMLGLAACGAAPVDRDLPAADAVARGKDAIVEAGCASCHAIPGISWPRGRVGPPLDDFGDRALIAGRFPNRPDILAAFLRDAPALVPESAMPPMPLTEGEARDAAAYLATLRAR